MIYTNDCFPTGLWHGLKKNDSINNEDGICITSSFEYAICNSMIEPGKEAGSINKVSFKKEMNLFLATSQEDLEAVQKYIEDNEDKVFWDKFDLTRLAEEDCIDVFTDEDTNDFSIGANTKQRFLNVIKQCNFDGAIIRECGKYFSISPALKKQEVLCIFDSSLLILENYLSGSEILKTDEFMSLREKEWEKWTQIYESSGNNKSAEKFLLKLKNKLNDKSEKLSVILTESELLGAFNRYGLKILSYQAGSIYSKNEGFRENYDCSKALLANSLFSDFLKENGLETYRRDWIESKEKYKWRQDNNGEWTRDIICVKFDYGVKTYNAEIKAIEDKKNKAEKDFNAYKTKKEKELEDLKNEEKATEKEIEYTEKRISNEIEEAEKDKEEKINFYKELSQFAINNEKKFPLPRETIKILESGKECIITSDIAIPKGQLRIDFYTAEDGIKIEYEDGAEIYYKPLWRTVGKAKQGAVYFCRYDKNVASDERFYDKAKRFLRMYKEFPDEKSKIVEIGAYQSLVSSNISGKIKINPSNILVIKDEDSYFESDIVRVYSEGPKDLKEGKSEVYKKENLTAELKNKLKNTMWDGQSLIDKSVFDKAYFFSSDEKANGWILCRQHFFKSACFCSDLKQFFIDYCNSHGKDYETFCVKDIWGKKHYVKEIELITTENSLKWMKFSKNKNGSYDYQGFKDWKKLVKDSDYIFGIVKTAHKSRYGDYQRMSFQMLNCLDINKIDKITDDSVRYLAGLKESTDEFVTDTSKDIKECEFIKFLDLHKTKYNDYEVLIALCNQDRTFFQSEYFRDRRKKIIYDYTEELRSGRILLKNSDNLTLVGNPYAMLLKAVGEDPLNDPTFKKGPREDGAIECFSSFFNEETPVAGFRSPFNSQNNLLYMYNIKMPDEFKYFIDSEGKSLFGNQVLIINCNQTCAQPRANGMDFDSDFAFCTSQKEICECAEEYAKNYPTIINDIELKIIKQEDLAKLEQMSLMELCAIKDDMLAGAREQIGEASNKALLALSYLSANEVDCKNIENIKNILTSLSQSVIDSEKLDHDADRKKTIDTIDNYLKNKEKFFPKFREIRELTEDVSTKVSSALEYLTSVKKDNEKDYQEKLKNDICVLSVLAQAAIDSAKREYDVDIEKSINTISLNLNISENQYPKFWKIVDDRSKFSSKGVDEEMLDSKNQTTEQENNSKTKKKKQGKIYKKSDVLACPMNVVFEKDYKSECNKIYEENKKKKHRSRLETLNMEDFFNADMKNKSDKERHSLLQNKLRKEVPAEVVKIEGFLKKFSLSLSENAKKENDDDEYDSYLLTRSDFSKMIKEMKKEKISSEVLFSWLIDRAFLITEWNQAHSKQIEAITKKNKSLLLKTLYDVDKNTLLKCFSRKIEQKRSKND